VFIRDDRHSSARDAFIENATEYVSEYALATSDFHILRHRIDQFRIVFTILALKYDRLLSKFETNMSKAIAANERQKSNLERKKEYLLSHEIFMLYALSIDSNNDRSTELDRQKKRKSASKTSNRPIHKESSNLPQ
jgi:hypothetical protein